MPAALLRRLLHAILPVACRACARPLDGDPVPFFCRRCWADITPLPGPGCPRCGRPFGSAVALRFSPHHLCGACRRRRPAFTQAWPLYPYAPPLRDAIQLFKYQRKVALADALGRLMTTACSRVPDVDLVVPIPLHPRRLREREFNQSLLLADRLAAHLGRPLSYTLLRRIRDTAPQTGLPRRRRLTNLRQAFAVADVSAAAGKRILLVDDVLTTGTTVDECARTLRRAGTADVYVTTLACRVS